MFPRLKKEAAFGNGSSFFLLATADIAWNALSRLYNCVHSYIQSKTNLYMKTHLIFLWFITFGVMACTSQPGINTGENKVEGDTIPVLDLLRQSINKFLIRLCGIVWPERLPIYHWPLPI